MGGAGKIDFERISEVVRNGLMSPDPETKTASLVALRISFNEKMELRWKDLAFSLLEMVQEEPNEMVKSELARVYFIFYDYDRENSFSHLENLAKEGLDVRLNLSRLLHAKRLEKEHYFALLKILASNVENSILDNISLSIAFRSKPEDVGEGLTIIHEWLKDGKFYDVRSLPIALNKLGRYDLDVCLRRIETWVREKKNYRIGFAAPKVAVEFAKDNFRELKDRLIRWMDEPDLLFFSLETVRALLESSFERSHGEKSLSLTDEEIVASLLIKLKDLARRRKLDLEKISKREQFNIYKCLVLVEEIEKNYEELDYTKISENWKRFRNIKLFLGQKWIAQMERKQNRTHPLLIYLSKDLLDIEEYNKKIEEIRKLTDMQKKRKESWRADDSVYRYALLSHLDQELEVIQGRRNTSQIKKRLRDEEHFWKIFSEIDVIARLARVFTVEISPKVVLEDKGKTKVRQPDLKVMINNTQVLAEVISPEMFAPPRYFRTAGIPNRLRSKVTEELRRHFIGMRIDRDIVIVIDTGSSEINYSSILDYVKGPLQFVMRMDKRSGRVVDTYVKRGKAMTKIDEETRRIIGIIGYNRVLGTDKRIHLRGRHFPNPEVLEKEKREVLKKIAQFLLG